MKRFPEPTSEPERRIVEFKEAVRARYRASGLSVKDMRRGDPSASPPRAPLPLTVNACYRVLSGIEMVPTGPTVRLFLTAGLCLRQDQVEELMALFARIDETHVYHVGDPGLRVESGPRLPPVENSTHRTDSDPDSPARLLTAPADQGAADGVPPVLADPEPIPADRRRVHARLRPRVAVLVAFLALVAAGGGLLLATHGAGDAKAKGPVPVVDPTFEQWVADTDADCLAALARAGRYEKVLTGALSGASTPAQIRKVADDITRDLQTRPGELPYPRVLHRAEAVAAVQQLIDSVTLTRQLADQVAAKGDVLTVLRDIQSTVTDGNNRLRRLGAVHCR